MRTIKDSTVAALIDARIANTRKADAFNEEEMLWSLGIERPELMKMISRGELQVEDSTDKGYMFSFESVVPHLKEMGLKVDLPENWTELAYGDEEEGLEEGGFNPSESYAEYRDAADTEDKPYEKSHDDSSYQGQPNKDL